VLPVSREHVGGLSGTVTANRIRKNVNPLLDRGYILFLSWMDSD
jgi:hypothetical protein